MNSINLKILKLAQEPIAEHLCSIYLLPQEFPDSLKFAKVTPKKTITKKAQNFECSNYRPITENRLSILGKMIEKMMHKGVMEFLNNQKVLHKKHFSFQKRFSTAHVIITLYIEKAIDNKLFVCGIFIDLQKAFDRVYSKPIFRLIIKCCSVL